MDDIKDVIPALEFIRKICADRQANMLTGPVCKGCPFDIIKSEYSDDEYKCRDCMFSDMWDGLRPADWDIEEFKEGLDNG